nr:Biomphalaria glabrata cytochrome b5 reductase 4-like; transcript variant X4 [Biomphalaria glabrata]
MWFISQCVCRLRILGSSNSISGIKFFCQQSLLPQDDTSDVFLRMVKLVFDFVINVTADVLLRGHYVKLERLQHHVNWFKNR